MTYDVGMTTTERAPLTRERIIEAAVALADEHGIDELSMRKLGAELGVEAMSLYNHVEDKGDIFDGMIDAVFSSIPLPDPDVSWQDAVRQVGAGAMDRLTAHPWAVMLLHQRGNFGPGALMFMDHVLAIFSDAGFNDEDTHHAWQMMASHTMGLAFQQATNPGPTEKDYANVERLLTDLDLPHVARLAPLLAQCEFDSEYLFGLEIIIDGLEARLAGR